MDGASLLLAAGVAAAAAVCDLRSRRIPNALTYPALGLGLALGLVPGDPLGPGARLLGAGIAFAPAFALFAARGVGGGDVKLVAAVGALVGAPAVVPVMVHALVAGALLALVWLALAGRLRQTAREMGALLVSLRLGAGAAVEPAPGVQVPFAPAVLVGLLWTAAAPRLGVVGSALAG